MNNDDFFRAWREAQGITANQSLTTCPAAQEFVAKMEDMLFRPLSQVMTRARIAQSKFLLQEEYHQWRKSHPHGCLRYVYEECYDRLHLLELRLRPPLNLILDYDELTKPAPLPSPPAPRPRATLTDIFLGEEDG